MKKIAVALGDIAEIVMGQSPPGSSYNRTGVGEPLLNGPAEFRGRNPIAVQWTTEPTRFAASDDILFCVRGATTGRKCWSDRRYAIGRGLAAIRGRSSLCDTRFLWFLLDVVTERLLKRAAGSTFANLPGEELLSFRVDLPPLAEQERIAGRLTEQLAAVERARGAAQSRLAAAESLPAAYLREVFEGVETEDNLAPLGEVAHVEMGQSPPGSSYNSKGHGKPLLNGPTEFGDVHPVAVQWTTEPTRFAEAGDILFCVRGATTGRKCRSDRQYCIGRGLAAIRGRDGVVDTNYLYYLLDVVKDRLLAKAAGSTFVNLPGAELEGALVAVPALPDQRRIAADLAARLAGTERLAEGIRAELAAIEALPAALLREAFGGSEVNDD